jgi:hypothetical protein
MVKADLISPCADMEFRHGVVRIEGPLVAKALASRRAFRSNESRIGRRRRNGGLQDLFRQNVLVREWKDAGQDAPASTGRAGTIYNNNKI